MTPTSVLVKTAVMFEQDNCKHRFYTTTENAINQVVNVLEGIMTIYSIITVITILAEALIFGHTQQ